MIGKLYLICTYIKYAHSIRCRHTVILIHTSSKYSYSTCGTNIFACYRHKVHNTVQNMWYYYGTELGNKSTVWYRHSVQKYAEQIQTYSSLGYIRHRHTVHTANSTDMRYENAVRTYGTDIAVQTYKTNIWLRQGNMSFIS